MRDLDDYERDRNWELNRQLERAAEQEARPQFRLPPRRRQFRYWSGLMFRPLRSNAEQVTP